VHGVGEEAVGDGSGGAAGALACPHETQGLETAALSGALDDGWDSRGDQDGKIGEPLGGEV